MCLFIIYIIYIIFYNDLFFSLSLQLHVEDLQEAIKYMHDNKKYKKVRSNMPVCDLEAYVCVHVLQCVCVCVCVCVCR